ncbi:carboxynorspermidine decarboxylase, putative [Pelagibacterium halotolerans B2]|uniref:Carboxynorspermidine/carboxyspermidine decarboxylase n=2 Tax=Pelagibacterium TaxID=1082930 RepID=G4RFA0_PELHB|nr:carboxynorspermidine decarboxylase, putative [Pelagibacterium halotolerans B2]
MGASSAFYPARIFLWSVPRKSGSTFSVRERDKQKMARRPSPHLGTKEVRTQELTLQTPYYLLDKSVLLRNLEKISYLRQASGVKCVLALKAFATWSVFDIMAEHMDGTTSSSLNEVKLGAEKFGGETHAYSVAWADHEIDEAIANCDKIIFNSVNQLERYAGKAKAQGKAIGLRLNPGVSHSHFILADPARPFSRLGEWDMERVKPVLDRISGVMFHFNCENDEYDSLDMLLKTIEERYGEILHGLEWVSLGGGIRFTNEDYPIEKLAARLKAMSERYGIQLYLEPGEASVTGSTTLEVSVLDVVYNGKHVAIVDSSTEAHMLDLLTYSEYTNVAPNSGPYTYIVCGKTCLAGDIFGEFQFETELKAGDRISFLDAGGYTMVKKNWFNGVQMPSIAVRHLDGQVELVKEFTFEDYAQSLS